MSTKQSKTAEKAMNKATAKKYIEQYVEWAFNKFGFTPANLDLRFEKECKDDKDAAMTARPDYPYRNYTIIIHPCALNMNKEQLVHCIHHELIHFILSEMCYVRTTHDKDEWRCALEKAVDHLAYLISFPEKYEK